MSHPLTVPIQCKEPATLFWRVQFLYDVRAQETPQGYVTALCGHCDSNHRRVDDAGEQWIAILEAEAERELAIEDVHES